MDLLILMLTALQYGNYETHSLTLLDFGSDFCKCILSKIEIWIVDIQALFSIQAFSCLQSYFKIVRI